MNFPDHVRFRGVDISQRVQIHIDPKKRYVRHRRKGPGKAYWALTVDTVPLQYAVGVGVAAFLDSLMGAYTIFSIKNPLPVLTHNSGLAVSVSAAQDATTLTLSGFVPNKINAAMAGDFIRCAGHAKVYRVVIGCDADAQGVGSITITPPLFEGVPTGAAILYGSDVEFQVCVDDDYHTMEVTTQNQTMISYQLDLIEQG